MKLEDRIDYKPNQKFPWVTYDRDTHIVCSNHKTQATAIKAANKRGASCTFVTHIDGLIGLMQFPGS